MLAEEGRPPESVFDFVQGITAVARKKPIRMPVSTWRVGPRRCSTARPEQGAFQALISVSIRSSIPAARSEEEVGRRLRDGARPREFRPPVVE